MTPEQQQAIEQLFRRHGKGVGSFILARVGDAGIAEEITAEVFLTVVKRYHQMRESALGWLWAIVRSELGRHFRRRGRLVPVDRFPQERQSSAQQETPADTVEFQETQAGLQHALARLSEEQQQIVGMKFFLGLRNMDIAAAMGLTPGTVGVKIHRALRELRDILEKPAAAVKDGGGRCEE